MKRKTLILTLLIGILFGTGFAQNDNPVTRKAYASPEEIVSFSRSMAFNQVLLILNELSKKFTGKVIIDPNKRSEPIGVDINNMHWKTAFEAILRNRELWYEEFPNYMQVKIEEEEKVDPLEERKLKQAKQKYHDREVLISAIFFEADVGKLRSLGTSWQAFREADVNLGVGSTASGVVATANNDSVTGGNVKASLFEISINPDFKWGDVRGILRTLESSNIGEVLASPQLTVRSGREGKIQVGTDVSVAVSDFAGNTVIQFFSTGSIIKVKPDIVSYDSVDFVLLDLDIERSSASRDGDNISIQKSKAETDIIMVDGEETFLGGLYVTEESTSREGIPFLKDLPWWFFGLKYLFGFESTNTAKKELLILLKAEILPTVKTRFERQIRGFSRENLLREKRRELNLREKQHKKQVDKK